MRGEVMRTVPLSKSLYDLVRSAKASSNIRSQFFGRRKVQSLTSYTY